MSKQDNTKLQEELKLRRWIRIAIKEDILCVEQQSISLSASQKLNEYSDNAAAGQAVMGAFIKPFKNLLSVAKVATKDLLSVAKLNWDILFTLRPSKQEEAKKKYQQRKREISQEWKNAMESVSETMATGEAKILGFMMNPAGFLGAELAKGASRTTQETIKFLEDSGWKKSSEDKDDYGTGGRDEKGKADAVDILGSGKKLLGDLSKIFFFAHHERSGHVLAEAEAGAENKEKFESSSGDSVTGVEKFLDKNPDLKDSIKKSAQDALESKKQHISDVLGIFEPQAKLLNGLANAKDLKSLVTILDSAKKVGFDMGNTGLQEIQKNIEADIKKILSNPSSRENFVKSYLREKGEKIPEKKSGEKLREVPDEELKPAVEKVIFMNAKQSLQEKLSAGIKNLKKQAEQEILAGEPPEADWILMSQTELGKQYVGLLQDAIKKIRNT